MGDDWIIDLGPGAGHDGGRIVFEAPPPTSSPSPPVPPSPASLRRHLTEARGHEAQAFLIRRYIAWGNRHARARLLRGVVKRARVA